ncbi:DUF4382 domain-containing protein [Nitrospira sp. NS4]|uniref:DUF4382 domain-containing protein n=1 Tax=Nitrospira sp. NS4 TaxID=3414498 RepID=UPI003C2AAFD0
MMNKPTGHVKKLTCLMGLLLAVLVTGCSGGDGGGGAATGTSAPGTLAVSLTDAPACGYQAVYVTVSKVRVHRSQTADDNAAGWSEIVLSSPQKINLLDLNDPTQPNLALYSLGETSLPAGHYTQVRLVLVPNRGNNQPFNNSIVLEGQPQEQELDTPSAVQSGIKLVNEFDVPSGQRVDLLLDFDACHSIVQRGNGTYALKPVIKVIPYVLNGIAGYISPSVFPNQVNSNHVAVSAQVDGVVVRSTVPDPVTGRFLLARLVPGTFDVVITADNRGTRVITGVPVNDTTSITWVSTDAPPAPPITLASSSTGDIGGLVTLQSGTDEESVIIAGKQVLSGGRTVTVKSRVATVRTATPDLGDYEYTLTLLPTEAPSAGPYVTPLPIVFTLQTGAANTYTVQASSTGYITGSVPNLATGTVQNFNLSLAP